MNKLEKGKKVTLCQETVGEPVGFEKNQEDCPCEECPEDSIIEIEVSQFGSGAHGMTRVFHDGTLEGTGLSSDPLKVAEFILDDISQNAANISDEITNREASDTTIINDLSEEIANRVLGDETLASAIEFEKSERIDSYNTLNSELQLEKGTRQVEVTTLGNRLDSHRNNYNNPHNVTQSQVGLGNVDNTSDLDKPVSIATQTALDVLQGNLNTEIISRQNADVAIDSRLTEVENNYVTTSDLSTTNGRIESLESLVPDEASANNKLADKDFVNSSIQTLTAKFDGNWATYAEIPETIDGFTILGLPVPGSNNYLVVLDDENHDNETWRYKYIGEDSETYSKDKWRPEYKVNDTAFTDAQLKAINSNITSELVGSYNSHLENTSIHVSNTDRTTWNEKQPALTAYNAGEGIAITGSGENLVITSTRTTMNWGNLTGNIADQTDLQEALADKTLVILKEW